MKVWKKQTIRYRAAGRNVPKGTQGAQRHVLESKRFYGSLRLADGRTKQVPLCEDRDASRKLLRRLQTEEDRAKALSGPDRPARERQRPLSELVAEYERELRSRENTAYHVRRTIDCIRALIDAATVADRDAGRIADALAGWRKRGRPTKRKGRKPTPTSLSRSNVYVRAVKAFSR